MKRKWSEKEKILAHRKFRPPECIGCFDANGNREDYHIFRKGYLCMACAFEVKGDLHRTVAGKKAASPEALLELVDKARTILFELDRLLRFSVVS